MSLKLQRDQHCVDLGLERAGGSFRAWGGKPGGRTLPKCHPGVPDQDLRGKKGCSFTKHLLCAGVLYRDHLSCHRNHEVGPCR